MLRTLSITTAGLLALTGASFAQSESGPQEGGDCTASVLIERGDTLGKIAQRCEISLSALMQANPSLEPRRLKIGERVNLPESGAMATGATAASGEGRGAPAGQSHTIRAGDTMFAIAREHNITLAALRDANPGVNPRRLRVGQSLVMPVSVSSNVSSRVGDDAFAGAVGDEGETTGTPGYGGGSTGAASIAAAQPDQASLIVTPSNGAVGSRVLIQGRNFAPREIIDIGYARTGGEAIAIGRVTASEQGDFTAQTTAPGNTTAGVQLIFYARGEGGQTIETQPFVIGAADGTASGSPVPEQNNGQL